MNSRLKPAMLGFALLYLRNDAFEMDYVVVTEV